jgi:hypothetical protein
VTIAWSEGLLVYVRIVERRGSGPFISTKKARIADVIVGRALPAEAGVKVYEVPMATSEGEHAARSYPNSVRRGGLAEVKGVNAVTFRNAAKHVGCAERGG